jgi:hypothetical protein
MKISEFFFITPTVVVKSTEIKLAHKNSNKIICNKKIKIISYIIHILILIRNVKNWLLAASYFLSNFRTNKKKRKDKYSGNKLNLK